MFIATIRTHSFERAFEADTRKEAINHVTRFLHRRGEVTFFKLWIEEVEDDG